MNFPAPPDRSAEASSRAVTRWLTQKIQSHMRRSMAELTARLRAEQEERGLPGR